MQPPFLARIYWRPDAPAVEPVYPLNLPLFADGAFSLELRKPITILVGENGCGKSTILEALAGHCGFSLASGNQNHIVAQRDDVARLQDFLRFSWRKKVGRGFFLRAESLQKFGDHLDGMAEEFGPEVVFGPYGGKSLNEQSHGEGFLSVLESRFAMEGLYILDEPEAALSPMRQLRLLALLDQVQRAGRVQIVMATHSPILMSYPHADLLEIKEGVVTPTEFRRTAHFNLMARFMADPDRFHRELFAE